VSEPRKSRPPLVDLLQAFYWCDESLQNYLRSRGWPEVTRPQSMVMAHLALGTNRPSEIARSMGISRQAVHVTINQLAELGMVTLSPDPTNGRVKVVTPTNLGETMRADAQQAMVAQGEELARRLGEADARKLTEILGRAWGAPLTFLPTLSGSDA
jgi:DNA-binding MarR family transcriptional regulator